MLKGLSKGAALAGAAVSLSSLATGQRMKLHKMDGKDYHCSVSGHMSVMLSAGTTAMPVCTGKKVVDYRDRNNWPAKYWANGRLKGKCYFGSVLRSEDDRFSECFGWGPSKLSIGRCVDNTTPDEYSDWVCAVLNANFIATNNYAYTSAEVVEHSRGINVVKADALKFHQGFTRGSW